MLTGTAGQPVGNLNAPSSSGQHQQKRNIIQRAMTSKHGVETMYNFAGEGHSKLVVNLLDSVIILLSDLV